MAELYVKPGNRERGWNDPPQFSYGLQQQLQSPRGPGGAKRGLLTRRAAPEGTAAAGVSEAASGPPPPHPPRGPGPVPENAVSTGLSSFPPQHVGLPPTGSLGPVLAAHSTSTLISKAEDDCGLEDVISPLNEALDSCRRSVQKQVCDDISKRLAILQQMWNQDKLSAPVRKGMRILTQELKSQHWDVADEIHRSLMVDHVTEVNQWMVGVKRLIAEARKLPVQDIATADDEQKVETTVEPECPCKEAEPKDPAL
uniref:Steroid receptor RNA activator 1 n=1 Tax=Salvator merianae TaxID=96440 RepID=A0A8D0KK08_SALMN